jgi:hypothetical protein
MNIKLFDIKNGAFWIIKIPKNFVASDEKLDPNKKKHWLIAILGHIWKGA